MHYKTPMLGFGYLTMKKGCKFIQTLAKHALKGLGGPRNRYAL